LSSFTTAIRGTPAKQNAEFAVKQIELPAHVSGGVVYPLVSPITEHQFHRLGQIVIRMSFAPVRCRFNSITNVVAVAVREQNPHRPVSSGEFAFAILENRIGQPRVDQDAHCLRRD